MLINLRNALMTSEVIVPAVLRSPGLQYIDLNWIPDYLDTIEIKYKVLNSISGQYAIVFGSNCIYNSSTGLFNWVQCGCSPGSYNFFGQNGWRGSWTSQKVNSWITATAKVVDAQATLYPGHRCFLFAQSDNNSPGWYRRRVEIEYFKVTHDGELSPYMHLVPIQNGNNPCMKDIASGKKYLNQGSGSFEYYEL